MKIYEERQPCILGVAVRGKRLRYCVLEPPDFLLDWGVKEFPNRQEKTIEKLLGHILGFYQPEYLVVDDVMHPACKLSARNIQMVREIASLALSKLTTSQSSVWADPKNNLGLDRVRKFDSSLNTIGITISVLDFHAPPECDPWHVEHQTMALFKAVMMTLLQTD